MGVGKTTSPVVSHWYTTRPKGFRPWWDGLPLSTLLRPPSPGGSSNVVGLGQCIRHDPWRSHTPTETGPPEDATAPSASGPPSRPSTPDRRVADGVVSVEGRSGR